LEGDKVTAGRDNFFSVEPPFALIERVEGESTDEARPRDFAFEWDLRGADLHTGIYELSYTFVCDTPESTGLSTMILIHDDTGRPIRVEPPVSDPVKVSILPTGAFFPKRVPGHVSYEMGQTHRVKIRVNLDKKTWSSEVNDVVLVEDMSFPEKWLEATAGFQISRVIMFSRRQPSDPAESYAIGNVEFRAVGTEVEGSTD
jgi:hypothetical protein